MIFAVLFTTVNGSSERYAKAISAALDVPAYPVPRAPDLSGKDILYVGWVLSGKVTGLGEAAKKGNIRAVAAVGMAPVNPKTEDLYREMNPELQGKVLFCLQGAFHKKGLPFLLRIQVSGALKGAARQLQALKASRELTESEQRFLDTVTTGEGEPLSWDGVNEVIDWAREQQQILPSETAPAEEP